MTARTAIAFGSGDTFIYFLQPVVTDALVAGVFLVSLATARPVVARLAADFYPMTHDLATRPRMRRLFWHLTLLWGLVCLAKGGATLWLLTSQSLVTFVVVKEHRASFDDTARGHGDRIRGRVGRAQGRAARDSLTRCERSSRDPRATPSAPARMVASEQGLHPEQPRRERRYLGEAVQLPRVSHPVLGARPTLGVLDVLPPALRRCPGS